MWGSHSTWVAKPADIFLNVILSGVLEGGTEK